uniref:LOB domain-containing protein 27-like n=1 Tax=Erigeron canadensis TaxID=72917 RepID=UPI001CB8A6E9|nr:LOB domain-containing protein 27-like [Erigeron canadensis]
MTLKGANTTQACAACKYQRKRCTPDCAFAPHFRPEHPLLFKNAHKLFGVRNILRILEKINPCHKTEAMQSIIFEANMRDQFPVHGCVTVIYDLKSQITQAEEELRNVLTQLAFYKQHHERQHLTSMSHVVSRGSLQLGKAAVQPENTLPTPRHQGSTTLPISSYNKTDVCVNAFWLQASAIQHEHSEIYSFFENIQE